MKTKGSHFCRSYKKQYKKQIVVCRICAANKRCEILEAYLEPDLILARLNRLEDFKSSFTHLNNSVCFGV